MSSESEEENIELFREALDEQFINNDMYKKNKSIKSQVTNQEETATQPKSLRRNIVEEDESFNLFKVTPQFQTYVSKQLAKILEKQLQDISAPNVTANGQVKKWKSKVRLLRDSKSSLKICRNSEDDSDVHKKSVRLEFDDEQEEENREKQCREVAVEPSRILNKEDVLFWSNRSKAPTYEYKKDKTGRLISKERVFT